MATTSAKALLAKELKTLTLQRVFPLLVEQDVSGLDDLRGLLDDDITDFVREYAQTRHKLSLGERGKLRRLVKRLRPAPMESKSTQTVLSAEAKAAEAVPSLFTVPQSLHEFERNVRPSKKEGAFSRLKARASDLRIADLTARYQASTTNAVNTETYTGTRAVDSQWSSEMWEVD